MSQQRQIQSQMDATQGYANYEAGNTYGLNANLPSAQSQGTQPGFSQNVTKLPGTTTYTSVPGSPGQFTETQTPTYSVTDTAPAGYTAVTGAPYSIPGGGADDVIGYNPSGDQGGGGTGLTQLQGYTNETPGGGGNLYSAPVSVTAGQIGPGIPAGYIDFGSGYNAQTNPTDYFYYSTYAQALEGGNNGVGLKGTNGTISYGSAPENQIAATPTVGVEAGGLEGDPTINGIDYTQGASYANLAANGIGTYVPGGIGTPESGSRPGYVAPYTQYTEPGYIAPTATAAGPTGTQSYNTLGQPITPSAPTNTPEGYGTEGTFYYGDNGSAGSISGVFSNNTPGQSTQFYENEPGSLTNAPGQSNLGTFQGQGNNATTATPAPTDTTSGYFSYGSNYGAIQNNNAQSYASGGNVNQATGGINGYNPLGLNQTDQSTLSGTDSALGYYGQVNPITGQTQANTNQTNPALQALNQSRSLN